MYKKLFIIELIIFYIISSAYAYQAKIIPDNLSQKDFFGLSVALSNDFAIIGSNSYYSWLGGYAILYKLNSETNKWSEEAILVPDVEAKDIDFGKSVSLSNEYAVIGAFGDRGKGPYTGAVYVYKKEATTWSCSQKLTASDGDQYDTFGYSVSLSNDFLIIGAKSDISNGASTGSAYIFKLINGVWTEITKIIPQDGANMDSFGSSVSISDNYAIVGSYNDDDNGDNSGSAYIYSRKDNSWSFQSKILPNDGTSNANFGFSVSISDDFAIVGAVFDDENGINSGSAYIFDHDIDGWKQSVKLISNDTIYGDNFGHSVSIFNSYAAAGSIYNNNGAVYIFKNINGKWNYFNKLSDYNGSMCDNFGYAVAISDEYIIAGSPKSDEIGTDSGSAFIFTKEVTNNPPSIINPIKDYSLPKNFKSFFVVNLESVFLDLENDELVYTATTDNNTSISLIENNLQLSSKLGVTGISQITVTANDGEYMSNLSFKVAIYEISSSIIPVNTDLKADDTIQMIFNEYSKKLELVFTKKNLTKQRRELWYKSIDDNKIISSDFIGYCLHSSLCPVSIAINPNTKSPAIAYRDHNNNLVYVQLYRDVWVSQLVTHIGANCSLDFDPSDNNPAIAFNSRGDYNLYYAKWNESEWNIELLSYSDACFESLRFNPITKERGISYQTLGWSGHPSKIAYFGLGIIDGSPEYVGGGNSLAFDNIGQPHITYFDHSNGFLKYTYFNSIEWSKQIIDSEAVGSFTSLEISDNITKYVSYVKSDFSESTLNYAIQNDNKHWNIKTILKASNINEWSSLALDSELNVNIAYIANSIACVKKICNNNKYDFDANGLIELKDVIIALNILTMNKKHRITKDESKNQIKLFYTSETHVVNGINAYKLDYTNTNNHSYFKSKNDKYGSDHEWYSTIYIKHEDDSQTLIGGPGVSYYLQTFGKGDEYFIIDETWDIENEYSLSPTDALMIAETIKCHGKENTRIFITKQLGWNKLNFSTWFFHKHGRAKGWETGFPPEAHMETFTYHGSGIYNSYIDGIEFSTTNHSNNQNLTIVDVIVILKNISNL